METSAITGNRNSRSDCEVTLEKTNQPGIDLKISSKVMRLYGKNIRALAETMIQFYDIKGVSMTINDNGALDFVLAARIEAAVKQIFDVKTPFLLPLTTSKSGRTEKSKSRVSRLYLPGNTTSMMINAAIHQPDGIILDLEDSVAPEKKQEARILVRNALRSINFFDSERMVRINQLPLGLNDLDEVVPENPHLILLPKCESAEQILQANKRIDELKAINNISNEIWLMPIIESALGVINAYGIATAATNIVGMAIGVEDYTADIGTQRTAEGIESLYASSAVINACRAAGLQTSDSVYSDVMDNEGLKTYIQRSKTLGFDGMGCIHPRQIPLIHDGYAPDAAQLLAAQKIVDAYQQAIEKGLGVVAVGTKMVDLPVVRRAQRVIATATARGQWKQNQNMKKDGSELE